MQKGYAEVGVLLLVAIASLLLLGSTGCATRGSIGEHAELSGSPVALRALMDGMVGMQKTAKEAPDARNEFFAHRAKEELEITARSKGSFLDGLFSNTQEAK